MERPLRLPWDDPFFRQEWRRRRRRLCAAGLALLNGLYVLLFLWALLAHAGRTRGADAPVIAGAFDASAWLLSGAVLLSICAHWLVPVFLLPLLGRCYELGPLVLMVRDGYAPDAALRGRILARLAVLAAGALPLLVGALLIGAFLPARLPSLTAALGAAALWGILCAAVSLWSGARWRRLSAAACGAYTLTTLALPAAIGAATVGIAAGCSMGHPNREFVFSAAAAITWTLLVSGAAAAFWDVSTARLFPEKRRPLWQELPEPEPAE